MALPVTVRDILDAVRTAVRALTWTGTSNIIFKAVHVVPAADVSDARRQCLNVPAALIFKRGQVVHPHDEIVELVKTMVSIAIVHSLPSDPRKENTLLNEERGVYAIEAEVKEALNYSRTITGDEVYWASSSEDAATERGGDPSGLVTMVMSFEIVHFQVA